MHCLKGALKGEEEEKGLRLGKCFIFLELQQAIGMEGFIPEFMNSFNCGSISSAKGKQNLSICTLHCSIPAAAAKFTREDS